jgi:hypothetical protein
MGADPPTVERVVRVRAAFVERLLRRAESAWWRRDLFDAGLPQFLDELDLTGAAPDALAFVDGLARLYAAVAELEALEREIAALNLSLGVESGQVSRWVWLPLVLVFAGLVQWRGAYGIGIAVCGGSVLAVSGLATVLVFRVRRRARQRALSTRALEQRATLARLGRAVLLGPAEVRVGGARYVLGVTEAAPEA